MKNMKTKGLAVGGVIGAIYFVLTVFLAPISFGQVQCRVSEMLLFLCVDNPFAIAGFTAGCVLANLTSPLGIIDVICGSACNLVAGLVAYKTKNLPLSVICGTVINGIVVGIELNMAYQLPLFLTMGSVALGEAISLTVGALIYRTIRRRIQNIIKL